MRDIEVYNINIQDDWNPQKRNMFAHLEVLSMRVIQKAIDITSNLGSDYVTVYMTYATFGDVANKMFHQVCSFAKDYNFDNCNEKFKWAKDKANYKSLKKLCNILRYYDIDVSFSDEKIEGVEELSIVLPDGVDPEFVLQNGFYAYVNKGKTGYWFRTSERNFTAQSNFVLTPLMHILSKSDNKRIIKIDNGFKQAVLDIPSRGLISLEFFTGAVIEEGNFLFYGGKTHLMRILNTIMGEFPVCYELKTLGWQPEGFYAWSNAILNPETFKIEYFNEIGIAEVDGDRYFSPAASSIYSGQRGDDDLYENDRYLRYIPPPIKFEDWAELMSKVYPEHALIGIAFIFIALYRDVVFKIDNNCPLLSIFGEKGGGKTKFAESLVSVFVFSMQAFNLNHGTDYAFFNRVSRFRNVPAWFEEFDDSVIRDERFQSIKGGYDGTGRERGKGTNKNRTEITRINSAMILTGQYISTRDDNAVIIRCLALAFTPDNNRTAEMIAAYEKLKNYEREGLTGVLTELLQLRNVFEKEYPTLFPESFNELRELLNKQGLDFKERILRNYSAVYNCLKIAAKSFRFPFTLNDVLVRCVADISNLSRMVSDSDSLADFWNTLLYLTDTGDIVDGFHFRIIHTDSIKVHGSDGERERCFPGIVKLLILRLGTIHKLYLESVRRQTGKPGVNIASLELYIANSKAFIGKSKSQRFMDTEGRSLITSCHVFNYSQLGISLERLVEEPEKVLTEIRGFLYNTPELVRVSGKTFLRYTIITIQMETEAGKHIKTEIKTNMLDPDPTREAILLTKNTAIFTGVLKISSWQDKDGIRKEKRTMEVDSVRLESPQLNLNEQAAPDAPF